MTGGWHPVSLIEVLREIRLAIRRSARRLFGPGKKRKKGGLRR